MKKIILSLSFLFLCGTAFATKLPKYESQNPTITNFAPKHFIPNGKIGFFDGQNQERFKEEDLREQSHIRYSNVRYNKHLTRLASRLLIKSRLHPIRSRGRDL